jgi:lipid-A-disaccharide synthase
VRAEFVGHPLADQIPLTLDARTARVELGLDPQTSYVALLPGSRRGEVSRLSSDIAATVAWVGQHSPDVRFIAAMANPSARHEFEAALSSAGVLERVRVFDGQAQEVMAASDAILLASGTATLEATLVKRPMVVVYRLGGLTSFLLKHLKLFKAPFFAQPNLLAGRALVPEYFNDEVRADVLGPAILKQLRREDRAALVQTFAQIHDTLRRDASARAADAIVELLKAHPE